MPTITTTTIEAITAVQNSNNLTNKTSSGLEIILEQFEQNANSKETKVDKTREVNGVQSGESKHTKKIIKKNAKIKTIVENKPKKLKFKNRLTKNFSAIKSEKSEEKNDHHHYDSNDDLAESQSLQSSTMVHHTSDSPVLLSMNHQQYHPIIDKRQKYHKKNYLTEPNSSEVSPLGGALADLAKTASQPASSSAIVDGHSNSMIAQTGIQQRMSMIGAKPGQFTLVSNHQVGPGHVTMIGYTTPIIKVGGIVKYDSQVPNSLLESNKVSISAAKQNHASVLQQQKLNLSPSSVSPATTVSMFQRSLKSKISSASPIRTESSIGSPQASASVPIESLPMYFEKTHISPHSHPHPHYSFQPQSASYGQSSFTSSPTATSMAFPSYPGFYGPEAGRALGLGK